MPLPPFISKGVKKPPTWANIANAIEFWRNESMMPTAVTKTIAKNAAGLAIN